jgi:HSP20 family protein
MAKKKGRSAKGNKKDINSEKKEEIAIREPYPWGPYDLMRNLDEEFEEFRRNLERSLWEPSWWRRSTILGKPDIILRDTKQPLIDIKDNGKELIIEAEMPGIPKENIDIQLTENSIEICGVVKSVKKDKKEGYYKQERSYSTCFRQMQLPEEVVPNKADANLEDGILHITIPKKKRGKKEKTHKVNVK